MRYDEWDVLLFPRDCKVPLKEFKVACHVVEDQEFSHTHGTAGIPTVCCFVPSLRAGTPFQMSLHSWVGFPQSQAAQTYSSFADSVKFEARLFVDGRLVSSSVIDQKTTWPHVFMHSYETGGGSEPEVLSFPTFRHELLKQSYWSPADDLGRIKLVISEGFPRNSQTNPIERVQNVVAFSFQHAPLEILEGSSIAWPNQAMWRRAPFAATLPEPPLSTRGAEAHNLSPSQRRMQHSSHMSGIAMTTALDLGPTGPTAQLPSYLEDGDVCALGYRDPSSAAALGNASTYGDWLTGLAAADMDVLPNDMSSRRVSRLKRATDTSMPDYGNAQGTPWELSADSRFITAAFQPDDDCGESNSKVPANTPTASGNPSYNSEAVPLSFLPRSSIIPSALAHSLTKSILNQPPPLQVRGDHHDAPASAVRSRKENKIQPQRVDGLPPAISSTTNATAEPHATRKVSQALSLDSTASVVSAGSTGGASLDNSIVLSRTNSPLGLVSQHVSQSRMPSQNDKLCQPSEPPMQDKALTASSGNAVSKGTKRGRNFTPASAKALDEENDPRRVSPRIGESPFSGEALGVDGTNE